MAFAWQGVGGKGGRGVVLDTLSTCSGFPRLEFEQHVYLAAAIYPCLRVLPFPSIHPASHAFVRPPINTRR